METTYRVECTKTSQHITDKSQRNQDFSNWKQAVAYFLLWCNEEDAENIPDYETIINQQTNWLCDARDYIITLEIIFS